MAGPQPCLCKRSTGRRMVTQQVVLHAGVVLWVCSVQYFGDWGAQLQFFCRCNCQPFDTVWGGSEWEMVAVIDPRPDSLYCPAAVSGAVCSCDGCAAQSNDDLVAVVRKFAEDYCKFEKATSSETVSSTREQSPALAQARTRCHYPMTIPMPCCAPLAGQGFVFVGVYLKPSKMTLAHC